MIGLVVYLGVLVLAAIMALIVGAFKYMPYVSYAFATFAMGFFLNQVGVEFNRPFIWWISVFLGTSIIHYFGDKCKRIKFPLAMLSGVGCSIGIILIVMLTSWQNDIVKFLSVYVSGSIIIVICLMLRTDVEYDDTDSFILRICAWIIGAVAIMEYSVNIMLIWIDYGDEYIPMEEQTQLIRFTFIAGFVFGFVISIVVDSIYTRIMRKKMEKKLYKEMQEVAELHANFESLGMKLNKCITLTNLNPIQSQIIQSNFVTYEELKHEIDFSNPKTESNRKPLEKMLVLMGTTDKILDSVKN